jgi:hypothetical protein
MTSITESIKSEVEQVIEESVNGMRDANLSPRSSDVYLDGDELFANIWFNDGDITGNREKQAMIILRQKLNEADLSIPTTVNANYQIDVKEDMIVAWWPV